MEDWSTTINNTINTKLEGVRDKDIRFYRIDEFKRNIVRIDSFSKSCPFCSKQKIPVSEISDSIDKSINVPGKARREYDRLISRLSKHMQKEHGFYPPFHYTYYYSFYGIVVGLALGFVLSQINPGYPIEMGSIGFMICIIPAYFWGHFKDKKIRAQSRLM